MDWVRLPGFGLRGGCGPYKALDGVAGHSSKVRLLNSSDPRKTPCIAISQCIPQYSIVVVIFLSIEPRKPDFSQAQPGRRRHEGLGDSLT